MKVLATQSLKEIVNLSMCNSEDLDCMYGRCQKCSKKEMIDRNSGIWQERRSDMVPMDHEEGKKNCENWRQRDYSYR